MKTTTPPSTPATEGIVLDRPVTYAELRHGIRIDNAMVTRGQFAFFPADITAASVRAQLVEHWDFAMAGALR